LQTYLEYVETVVATVNQKHQLILMTLNELVIIDKV